MKSKFVPDQQDQSGGSFNPAWDDPDFQDFRPPAVQGGAGSDPHAAPIVPTPALSNEAVQAQSAQTGPTSTVVVTSGGITFNLIFDAAATAAPASFRAGIEQAASLLAATITNKITVNIGIDDSGTGGGAAAGPDGGQYMSYSTVRTDLINNATAGDTTFNALPTGSTIQGQSQVAVWNAQLKLFGLLPANSTATDDGSATFATDINPKLLVGVALHELVHALGRIPYGSQPDIFDFDRFTSAGTYLFTDTIPASPAYFSLDGGKTRIAQYGQNSDPSDFLNGGSNLTPNDAFNEYYSGSTLQQLTAIDLKQLDALGYDIKSATSQRVASAFTGNGTSDVLWINPTNDSVGDWLMNQGTPTWQVVGQASATVNIKGVGDFNGNGTSDVLWANPTNGLVGDWLMNNNVPAWQQIGQGSTTMNIAGTGDFNGDGTDDILWQNPANNLIGEWLMNNNTPSWALVGQGSTTMNIVGTGDFMGNGRSDILWENSTNHLVGMWAMNGAQATWSLLGQGSTTMNIVGTGDFTGNGTDDILWENPTSGSVGFWAMTNGQVASWNVIGTANTSDQVAGIGDYYGNGTDDILWRNPITGDTALWQMNNGQATPHDLGILSTTLNPVKA